MSTRGDRVGELSAVHHADAGVPDPLPPLRRRAVVIVALLALVGLGAAIRAHGFTDLDLWFDDAWSAAPARVGWSKAVHMVLTAPGYGLALRLWLRLDPTTTWFTQLPAYVLGLCAIPAVYGLLRLLRNNRAVALAGALVVAVDPILVQYSTRLKEYPFDLLAACAVLALAERARRRPARDTMAWLAVVSAVALFFSAGSLAVVAGAWLALAVCVLRDRPARAPYLGALGALGAACLVIWAVFLRHLPSVLNFNWRRRGYLVDYRSLGRLERTVTLIFGGFLHGALAYPVPAAFFRARSGLHTPSAAALGFVLLALSVGVPVAASWRRRSPTPALAAAFALALAILFAVADKIPFGDGRTDEALYPAFLVCLAAIASACAPFAHRVLQGPARRAVATSLSGALVAGAVAFGVAHPSVYPTLSLRDLWARLRPELRPGQVIFVDTFNSFAWCYYELTPCRTQVGGAPPWPQGFRPVSKDTSLVFIPKHYGIPEPELDQRQRQPGITGIWYVGYDYGTYDVGAGQRLWNFPVNTYMLGDLRADGWVPAPPGHGTRVLGITHCYAELFVRRASLAPRTHASGA